MYQGSVPVCATFGAAVWVDDRLQLLTRDGFFRKKDGSSLAEDRLLRGENCACAFVLFIDQAPHFAIDFAGRFFAVVTGLFGRASEERIEASLPL